MIFFRPITDSTDIYSITFEASENNIDGGSCHMIIEGSKATVDRINFDSDKSYLVEGLLRSAFNYAANKNCYMGYCTCINITSFLDNMNFCKKDNVYFNDIPAILQGKCCKSKDSI